MPTGFWKLENIEKILNDETKSESERKKLLEEKDLGGEGDNAVVIVFLQDRGDLIKKMQDLGIDVNDSIYHPSGHIFLEAVKEGKKNVVDHLLLDEELELEMVGQDACTALSLAIQNKDREMAKKLILAGANLYFDKSNINPAMPTAMAYLDQQDADFKKEIQDFYFDVWVDDVLNSSIFTDVPDQSLSDEAWSKDMADKIIQLQQNIATNFGLEQYYLENDTSYSKRIQETLSVALEQEPSFKREFSFRGLQYSLYKVFGSRIFDFCNDDVKQYIVKQEQGGLIKETLEKINEQRGFDSTAIEEFREKVAITSGFEQRRLESTIEEQILRGNNNTNQEILREVSTSSRLNKIAELISSRDHHNLENSERKRLGSLLNTVKEKQKTLRKTDELRVVRRHNSQGARR